MICPNKREIFIDPVVARYGNTYEYSAIIKWLLKVPNSTITNLPLNDTILGANITVWKLLINLSARAINNIPPPTTEAENLSVGHASRHDPLVSNTFILNSMYVLPETISEGHASRHEPDDLSVRNASRQDPLILNASVPNAMNVLPGTVSHGHA